MNFVELCRKGAGWPALHRDVPQFDKNGRWAITQEELASFIGQVRSRSDDVQSEMESRNDLCVKLASEKAAMAAKLAQLGTKLSVFESQKSVSRKATSMGLETGQVKQLEEAVVTDH